jgi:hypothetical protein
MIDLQRWNSFLLEESVEKKNIASVVSFEQVEPFYKYFYVAESNPINRENDTVFQKEQTSEGLKVVQVPRISPNTMMAEDSSNPRVSLGTDIFSCFFAKQTSRTGYVFGTNQTKGIYRVTELFKKRLQAPLGEGFGLKLPSKEKFFEIFQDIESYEGRLDSFYEKYRIAFKELLEEFKSKNEYLDDYLHQMKLIFFYDNVLDALENYIEKNGTAKDKFAKPEAPFQEFDRLAFSKIYFLPDMFISNEHWSFVPVRFDYIGRIPPDKDYSDRKLVIESPYTNPKLLERFR